MDRSIPACPPHSGRGSQAAAPAWARPATPRAASGLHFGHRCPPGDLVRRAYLRPLPPAARLSWHSRSLPPRRCAPSPAAPAGTRPPPARFSGGEAAGEAAAGGTSSASPASPPEPRAPAPRYLPGRRQGPVHVEETEHPATRRRHPGRALRDGGGRDRRS